MLNIVLFGAPGSGKGTQAEKLIEKYDLIHISTGDLLRNEVAANTELGNRAQEIIDKGELVSDEIVIGMISNKLGESKDVKGYIFDGFPRTVEQARELRKLLADYNSGISIVVSLTVPKEELIQRLVKRGEESGRSDDTIDTITNRIEVYERQTIPVARYYEKTRIHVPVDGTGKINDIFKRIVKEVDEVKD